MKHVVINANARRSIEDTSVVHVWAQWGVGGYSRVPTPVLIATTRSRSQDGTAAMCANFRSEGILAFRLMSAGACNGTDWSIVDLAVWRVGNCPTVINAAGSAARSLPECDRTGGCQGQARAGSPQPEQS
jgi:hypothetical protein